MKANQTDLREWSRYTFEQLVDYIVQLTNRIDDVEQASNQAYDRGYQDGIDAGLARYGQDNGR